MSKTNPKPGPSGNGHGQAPEFDVLKRLFTVGGATTLERIARLASVMAAVEPIVRDPASWRLDGVVQTPVPDGLSVTFTFRRKQKPAKKA